MPFLRIGGIIQGPARISKSYGPCEWCGEILTQDEACSVQSIFSDNEAPELEGAIIQTRMCAECFDIYRVLGREGIEED